MALITVGLLAPRPNPYAFLDRFQAIDLMRISPPVHLPGGKQTVTVKFLQFADSDAPAVRAALLRELGEPAVDSSPEDSFLHWDRGRDHVWFTREEWIRNSAWQLEVDRDETWLDRQIAGVRSLLHV
jgi:hypothetical protein